MTLLDSQFLEALLRSPESNVLDFKRAQYSLADDEKKAEIVKDVVAFANTWKVADAYILIGVEDGHGSRGVVHGLAPGDHIDDATLQQLVGAKLNRAPRFEYLPTTLDGKSIAVIRIARDQERPFFLMKKFGRLEPGKVYIRQGSSTVTADPDDVARMGQARVPAQPEAELKLSVCHPETHELFSLPLRLTSKVLIDPPKEQLDSIAALAGLMASIRVKDIYAPDPEATVSHRRELALLTPLAFAVENTGSVLLEDVTIRVELPKLSGLVLIDDAPVPSGYFTGRAIRQGGFGTTVAERGKVVELIAKVGKVQTHATAWSEPFWIGSSVSRTFTMHARVGADCLTKPVTTDIEVRLKARKLPDDASADEPDPDPDG